MTDIHSDEQAHGEAVSHITRRGSLRDFWQRWRAWVIGPLLIGITGMALAVGCDYASHLNRLILEQYPRASLCLLPVGFAIIVYLMRRFFRGAQGGGIAQTIAAIQDSDPRKKHTLLSPRILIGKSLLLMGGFFAGGSIGREGPAVQIGASIMHSFYGYGKKLSAENRRKLIIAGGGAGIAVAFSTPLAGIVFAIEELGNKFVFKELGVTLSTVLLSTLIPVALLGSDAYFGSTSAFLNGFADAHVAIVCGIVGGIFGGLFSRLMIKMSFHPPAFISSFMWNRPVYFAAFCGIFVALLGLATDNLVFGSGYDQTLQTIHSVDASFDWYYGPAKFVATLLCGISGIPAGMFAPSLSVGAGLGDGLFGLLPSLGPHGAIVILMMAAYLTGVMRSPLTALVITMEMTAGFHLMLPLLAAVLIANGVSKLVSPLPMYTALAEKFSRD
jgi:H+/Cl- antiporter ClcA